MLPRAGFLSDWGFAKLPKAPIGAKAVDGELALHGDGEAGAAEPKGAVVLRLSDPKGLAVSVVPFSLSRSSDAPLGAVSLKSVRRRTRDGGGETALDSSREKREVAGEARLFDGKGYASLVSRRRTPGRLAVGDDSP
jgi:hypothetical protein